MQISGSRCDKHPTFSMTGVRVRTLSVVGDVNDIEGLRCTAPRCSRFYNNAAGYHDRPLGGYANAELGGHKPRCGAGHNIRFMVVTEDGRGSHIYRCPVPDCGRTETYPAQLKEVRLSD